MVFELRSVVGQRVDSNNLSSPKERRILSHRPTTHCLLGTTQWLSLCCAPLRRPASAVVSQRVELSLYKENGFAVLRARHRRRGTGYRRVNCGNWGWGRLSRAQPSNARPGRTFRTHSSVPSCWNSRLPNRCIKTTRFPPHDLSDSARVRLRFLSRVFPVPESGS